MLGKIGKGIKVALFPAPVDSCLKCRISFAYITRHLTAISWADDGTWQTAMTPLCENCWKNCDGWRDRLFYYLQLVREWEGKGFTTGSHIDMYEKISFALKNESGEWL